MTTYRKKSARKPRPWHAAFALLWLVLGTAASVLGASDEPSRPSVLHAEVRSAIHTVSGRFIAESIERAEAEGADLVVLELDTPGGLSEVTHEITKAILGSEVPVVVFVGPKGARAASAGFFILMAADVAAMAPGTNTGASASVNVDGEDIDSTMAKKVEEDSRAKMRALAERRGRPVDLAEATVTEARSYSADECLENGLIDVIADDLDDLLDQLHGREVSRGEATVVLASENAQIEKAEMDLFDRVLSAVANPSVAYLLFSLGGLGLMLELYNPGSIVPGVIGAICLLLGFFGLSVLPVRQVGVALVLLGVILFIAEIKVVSYGFLTIGGVLCLVFGGLMLIDSPDPALQVSRRIIATVAVVALLSVAAAMALILRAHRNPVVTGAEGLLQERGRVDKALDPKGKVFVHGELWAAFANEPIETGAEVEVIAVDRLTLEVRRVGVADTGSA